MGHWEEVRPADDGGIFGIRGDLDGARVQDFTQREQFIGLKIGSEEFYLSISAVNEIIMLSPVTYVPQGPANIEGVINLRGKIIPAINMRKMIGLGRQGPTAATRVIISKYGESSVGLIVDAITSVASLLPSEIESHSLSGKGGGAGLISSVSKQNNHVIGILDLSKIIVAAGGTALNPDDDIAAA